MKRYFLFLDESGHHNVRKIDRQYPIFVLCGVLFSEENYAIFNARANEIKKRFWGTVDVIFHSIKIRNCDGDFKILFDREIKREFYSHLESLFKNNSFTIITSVINPEFYLKKYQHKSLIPYEKSLEFIMERAIYCIDKKCIEPYLVHVVLEKRNSTLDNQVSKEYERLLLKGNSYTSSNVLKVYAKQIAFRTKSDNVNGLQLADISAYPIGKHFINPEISHPTFPLICEKVDKSREGKLFGLKIFPSEKIRSLITQASSSPGTPQS